MDFLSGAWEGLINSSLVELIGVVSGLLYLVLLTRENLWCWFFGALSSALYIYITVTAGFYSDMLLNFYYLFMSGYGYYAWTRGKMAANDLPISWMGFRLNVILMIVIVIGTAAVGYIMANFAGANLPYTDAFTTIGALVTTWMVTRKYLENWIYWIVVDGVAVWMYWQKGFQLTSLLFAVYVVLVIIGLIKWSKIYNSHREMEPARGNS